jgi:hypothetical protein
MPAWGAVPYIGRFDSLCFGLSSVADSQQDRRNPPLHCRQCLLWLECRDAVDGSKTYMPDMPATGLACVWLML